MKLYLNLRTITRGAAGDFSIWPAKRAGRKDLKSLGLSDFIRDLTSAICVEYFRLDTNDRSISRQLPDNGRPQANSGLTSFSGIDF